MRPKYGVQEVVLVQVIRLIIKAVRTNALNAIKQMKINRIGTDQPVQRARVINRHGIAQTNNALLVQRQNHIGIQPHKRVKRVMKLTMQNHIGTRQQRYVKLVQAVNHIGMDHNVLCYQRGVEIKLKMQD